MFFAITLRSATAFGGAVTRFAVLARAPSTLSRVGATCTLALTGAAETCCALTCTLAFPTGCALANVRCGTAVTAFCAVRFTYLMFVILVVLLLMMVVLFQTLLFRHCIISLLLYMVMANRQEVFVMSLI